MYIAINDGSEEGSLDEADDSGNDQISTFSTRDKKGSWLGRLDPLTWFWGPADNTNNGQITVDVAGMKGTMNKARKMLQKMKDHESVYAKELAEIVEEIAKHVPLDQMTSQTQTVATSSGIRNHPHFLANNGFGDNSNGITITSKGFTICCYYNLVVNTNAPIELRNDVAINYSCQSADDMIKRINIGSYPKPETNVQRVLAGSYWSLKDFELLETVGRGAYGTVFLCRLKHKPSIQCVLKIQFFDSLDFGAWSAEACQASLLKHPNIVRVLGYFPIPGMESTESKNIYGEMVTKRICMALMMEPCDCTLYDGMEEIWDLHPKRRLIRACEISMDILAGLVALENANMTHRDIKPNNILEGYDGRYKIGDFGFARQSPTDGTMSILCGTTGYLPPEGPSPKQDVFAAGKTFLQLLNKGDFLTQLYNLELVKLKLIAIGLKNAISDEQFNMLADLCHGMLRRFPEQRLTAKRALPKMKKLLRDLQSN
jgi:hypothetical protein